MGILYPDTHPRIENLQVQMWRQASPARKMHMLAQLNATVRTLALAGLRSRYADADNAELCSRLADLLWGKEIACKIDGGTNVQTEPLEVTFKVADVFERHGIPYLVGGSLASILYGMVRSTQDVDIVAEMCPEHIPSFVSALQGEFLVDEQMVREAVQNYSSFNIIHREGLFKVDVFIPRPSPFTQSQLARAQRQTFTVGGQEVSIRFASPEDIILAKLDWYRLSGEVLGLQWRDVLGVLKTCAGSLDMDYLRRWAEELMVSDLLERALHEADR